ncbi:MAG: transposase, partial [Stellaceae bacterium]
MAIITQPYFWDEQAAHAKLERLVWPDGPICPHCSARERIGAVTGKGARTALKFCCHCRKQFRATMGTMFEGSHVPLHKWFQACFLLTTTHRGISPHQLHLRLEVTNKTALAMVHRIEEARRGVARGGSAEGGLEGARRRV